MWTTTFDKKSEKYVVSWASIGDPQPTSDRYSETEEHSSGRSARRAAFMREAQELGVQLRATPRARAHDEARPGRGDPQTVGLGGEYDYY